MLVKVLRAIKVGNAIPVKVSHLPAGRGGVKGLFLWTHPLEPGRTHFNVELRFPESHINLRTLPPLSTASTSATIKCSWNLKPNHILCFVCTWQKCSSSRFSLVSARINFANFHSAAQDKFMHNANSSRAKEPKTKTKTAQTRATHDENTLVSNREELLF